MFATRNQALNVHGIPSTVRWTGVKGERHSGGVFKGVHRTAEVPRTVEPPVTVSGIHLQRGKI